MTEETPTGATSATVGWLELFFDLVVVAAVAVLTHGLQEDPSVEGLALFAMLFTAIWFSWVSVVLYANVAGDATRTRTIVVVAWAVPCTLGPLVVAAAGAELRPALLVWLLLGCATWLAAYPSVTGINGMRST